MSNILWIDSGDRKVKYCFTIFNKEIANIYFTVIVPTSADKNIDIIACTWPRNKLNIIFIAPWTHNTAFIISYFLSITFHLPLNSIHGLNPWTQFKE